jgi:osmotically inducible lipoprotein OsmB
MRGKVTVILATLLSFAACAGMSAMEQRVLSGGALGAGSGALIGAAAGSASIGAAIGGGAGLLAGYAYDQYQKPRHADSRGRETSDPKKPRPGKRPDGGATKKIPEKVPPQEISPAGLQVM